jgi:hypothetical protein
MWRRLENGPKSGRVFPVTDNPSTASDVHSEARGPHWIAWLAPAGGASAAPDRSIIFVGKTREQAEANARQFASQARY